ncbi:MAG TPA: site-specific integrase [Candidatus Limnocylindrales bacterium]|nr:site-specific integrase [Candidatus Limnocylindrales bacterium]
MGRHGAGSVTTRPNGLIQVSLTLPGGRRVYRYTRNPKAVAGLLRELVEMRERDLDPSGQTVADFLRSWIAGLRDARRQRIRPRTLEHYAMIVERHIIPALGKHRLDRLREHHVQAWLDADAAAPRTIHHHRAVLRRALNVAVRQRMISANPALGVELPDPRWEGQKPLSVAEARALLASTAGDRLGPLWRLALDTGLRQSELLGLAWDDVDLDAGTLTVSSQLQRIAGSWVRTPTKARRSLEVLALAPSTVTALAEHKRRMAGERTPEWRYYGLVFPTPRGEPYTNHVLLRAWRAACDQAGIGQRRFHDIRHSTASIMRELNVAEDVRMARLGHSTTAMARRYGHAGGDQDRAAAEALERALAG